MKHEDFDDKNEIETVRAGLETCFASNEEFSGLYTVNTEQNETQAPESWVSKAIATCNEEECPIPDELKVISEFEQSLNVLEFLGIQRAKPLEVEPRTRDWE
eukprot:CAMPEP_0194143496 /NCGR_PEP_ID=MMETSP0152-20130528/12671_1 /TAXON_ID=1049557 /ORGANISM="Thalassiothrix antarctica, Strain L6-D1" /LENGTH=101 /DNA_ID=CAMNT_0038842947 /DNA_START=181 /DNA_END=486 /DNA_ORIENTATION=-